MAITALHANPKILWYKIANDLSAIFGVPDTGIINAVNVAQQGSECRDIFLSNTNYLIAGRQAHEYFCRRLPVGHRIKQLEYGSPVPILYLVDSVTGFSWFATALYYPEPSCFNGRVLKDGCHFLLENQVLRDRLFIHQARRHFAPHESTIFGIAASSLPPAANGRRSEIQRQIDRRVLHTGMAPVQEPPRDDIPF